MADSLADILNEADGMGLLRVSRPTRAPTADSRVADTFARINAFVDSESRLPHHSARGEERTLALRLRAMLDHPDRYPGLDTLEDPHNLLSGPAWVDESTGRDDALPPSREATPVAQGEAVPSSLADIFADDDSGLLDTGPSDIHDIVHVARSQADKRLPETIAQAVPCPDFWRYEASFRALVDAINTGRAETARFQYGSQIEVGHRFIVRGMLCLVDSIIARDDSAGETNPRMRIIFSNATESNMLKLSLARALYKDDSGRRVIPGADETTEVMTGQGRRPELTGRVYVVRSLANHPALADYPNLFKVGFTTGSVEDRIANAENDPAFLEGPVRMVRVFDCYDMNPNRLENLLHAFLADRRLSLLLQGKDGHQYKPREWFAVTEETVVNTIQHLLDGTINQVRLDPVSGQLRT